MAKPTAKEKKVDAAHEEEVVLLRKQLAALKQLSRRLIVGLCIALVMTLFALVGVGLNTKSLGDRQNSIDDQTDDIAAVQKQSQAERSRNLTASCLKTEQQNGDFQGFIIGLIPPDRRDRPQVKAFIQHLHERFPVHTTHPDLTSKVFKPNAEQIAFCHARTVKLAPSTKKTTK